MARVIFHIGAHKTATTALQHFFFDNRELLAKQGVAFPLFSGQNEIKRNGLFLTRYCGAMSREAGGWLALRRIKGVGANLSVLDNALTQSKRVLLTDEHTFIMPDHGLGKEQDARLRYWQTVADTLKTHGADGVDVVVYLRRQDEWISSFWRQCSQGGHTSNTAHRWYSTPSRYAAMDYADLIKTLEHAFGDSCTISVRRYNRNGFYGGDIFHDFCEAAGIAWDESFLIPEGDINSSITYDVAEALLCFKKTVAPNIPFREAPLRDVLWERALELSLKEPDPPGMTFFTPDEARELMERYEQGNRWIAERFFGGEPLFSDNYDSPTWAPDKTRIERYRKEFQAIVRQHPIQVTTQLCKSSLKRVLYNTKARLM